MPTTGDKATILLQGGKVPPLTPPPPLHLSVLRHLAPVFLLEVRSGPLHTRMLRVGADFMWIARAGGRTPVGGRAGSAQPEVVQQLRAQVQEMSTHLEGLEKERDFYFEKVM